MGLHRLSYPGNIPVDQSCKLYKTPLNILSAIDSTNAHMNFIIGELLLENLGFMMGAEQQPEAVSACAGDEFCDGGRLPGLDGPSYTRHPQTPASGLCHRQLEKQCSQCTLFFAESCDCQYFYTFTLPER